MKFQRSVLSSAILIALSGSVYGQGGAQELELTKVESIERDAVVEVVTIEDIDAEQIGSAEELVRYIPGVSVSRGDDRWGSSGFNIRGLDEDRVAINVDGVPQGETLKYEGGQAYGYFKGSRNGVDIEALKRIEVVKGADGILSGSGSLAGAVNMTTKDPADFLSPEGNETGGNVKLGYAGVNEERLISFALANRTGDFESMMIYSRRDGHEYENYDMDGLDVEGSTREVPDPRTTDSESILAKVIYNISPNQKIGVVGSFYERNGMTDTQSFNGGWYSNRRGDDVSETNRIGLFHELTLETALFDSVSTAINKQEISFEANTSQHVEFNFGPSFSSDEDRVDTRAFDQDLLQVTVDFEKALGEHNLSYGIEFQDKEFDNTQTRIKNSLLNDDGWVDSNTGALIPQSEAEVMTLYALDTFALSDTTQLRLGARFDDYTYDASGNENYADDTGTLGETSFSTLTWTLGLEQVLTETLTLEAGVSTGFRAPTIEDMYSTSGAPDDWSVIANPDLEAEYATNFDLALVGEFDAGSYRAGIFYSKYEDFIDYLQTEGINDNTGLLDPDGYRVPTNLNEVDMKGVELAGNLDLNQAFGWAQGFSTGLRAAYTEGEMDNGDPVYSVQPLNAIWSLTYDNPNGVWGVNLSTSYTAGKKNDDSFSTDDLGVVTYPLYLSDTVTVFDLIGYYDIGEDLRIVAGVYNLTDQEYYNWDSVRFVDQGDLRPGIGVTENGIRRYSEPGRNFEVQVNYLF